MSKLEYVVSKSTLSVLDVLYPDNPITLGEYTDNTHNYLDGDTVLFIKDKLVYVVSRTTRCFSIFDVTDYYVPILIGTVKDKRYFKGVKHISVSGDYAFAWSKHNVNVVDISDPTFPNPIYSQPIDDWLEDNISYLNLSN